MAGDITWVGMDAHKKFINVAVKLPEGEELVEWRIPNEPQQVRRLARKLVRMAPGEVRCCYEAGPCGFVLMRQLEAAAQLVCEVVAPSLIPRKPGERIKTDRRDARKLAELNRAGLLTVISPPSEEQEAMRDLCRCREDATEDRMRARHRLSKWLLRRAIVYPGRAWTSAHSRWLHGLKLDRAADRAVYGDYMLALEHLDERIRTLDEQVETASQSEPYREPCHWLQCFRGVRTARR